MVIAVGVGIFCLSCMDQGPVQPRGRPIDVQVEQAIPDGCARFQIHANPGQTVTIDSIYGTQYCQTDELKLIQDSAAVFDAATGKLRVPIVVKNIGTRAVRGLLKIRYDADSVQLFDTNGNPVAGPTTIVGLGDSTLNNGRVAYWGYTQLLAPSGQLQVLFSGQTSGRRWLELQGTDWNRTVKIKLFTTARYDSVPATPPDSIPAWMRDTANYVLADNSPSSIKFLKNALRVAFKPGTPQAKRQSAIDAIGGVVVGGLRMGSDGVYYVQVNAQGSTRTVVGLVDILAAMPQVFSASEIGLTGLAPSWRKPNEGPSNTAWNAFSLSPSAASGVNWALERIEAPAAWGCETGAISVRIGVLDSQFDLAGQSDLPIAFSNVNFAEDSILKSYAPSPQYWHGDYVASQVTATGNNGKGMTGVMWSSALDVASLRADPDQIGQPRRYPPPAGPAAACRTGN